MRGVLQGLFLVLLMTIIGLVTYNIGTTSVSMQELMGRAILWGLVIGWSGVLIWERL